MGDVEGAGPWGAQAAPRQVEPPAAAPGGGGWHRSRLAGWLDALARRYPGGEVRAHVEPDLAAAAAALVLEVDPARLGASSAVVDWVAPGSPPGSVPQLVGLGLDWIPPPARRRSPFPGGPGPGRD